MGPPFSETSFRSRRVLRSSLDAVLGGCVSWQEDETMEAHTHKFIVRLSNSRNRHLSHVQFRPRQKYLLLETSQIQRLLKCHVFLGFSSRYSCVLSTNIPYSSTVRRTKFFESLTESLHYCILFTLHTRRVFFKGDCRVSEKHAYPVAQILQVQSYIRSHDDKPGHIDSCFLINHVPLSPGEYHSFK